MSEVYVEVLYDFKYYTEDENEIKITAGEELLLLKKSNKNWWQVIRNSEENPFYAPSSYLNVIGVKCKKIPESIDVNSNFTDNNHQIEQIENSGKSKLSEIFKNTVQEVKLRNADLNHKSPKDGLAFKNPLCDEFLTSSSDRDRGRQIDNELTFEKKSHCLNPKNSEKDIEKVNIQYWKVSFLLVIYFVSFFVKL